MSVCTNKPHAGARSVRRWGVAMLMILALLVAGHARAQDPPPWLSYVHAPGATCAAVSAPAKTLLIGGLDDEGGYLALRPIKADGTLGAESARLPLAPPDAKSPRLRPLDVKTHPTLPLAYVWRDRVLTEDERGTGLPTSVNPSSGIDHLMVIDLSGKRPKLVLETARSLGVAGGQDGGTITVDAEHGRLFLPNLLMPIPESEDQADEPAEPTPALGFVELAEDGLPRRGEDGRLHPTTEALGRGAMRAGGWPGGLVVGAPGVVAFNGYLGFGNWFINDPQHRLSRVPVRYGRIRIALGGHPEQPRLYLASIGTPYFYTIAHANGVVTMMPRELTLPTSVTSRTVPLVLPEHGCVLLGTHGRIMLVGIDSAGRFDGTTRVFPVPVERATAYARSAAHGRVFLAVDEEDQS